MKRSRSKKSRRHSSARSEKTNRNTRLAVYAAAAGAVVGGAQLAQGVPIVREVDEWIFNDTTGTTPDESELLFPVDINEDGFIDVFLAHEFDNDGPFAGAAAIGASPYFGSSFDGQGIGGGVILGPEKENGATQEPEKEDFIYGYPPVISSSNKIPDLNADGPPYLYKGGVLAEQNEGPDEKVNAQWEGQRGFLGVIFDGDGDVDQTTSDTHAGFLELSVDAFESDMPLAIHIHQIGYETRPFTPIHPGIPEPIGLGYLALGAAGLLAMRRRARGN